MRKAYCGEVSCRSQKLTMNEFERLGGETFTQGFRVQLAYRAGQLHEQIYKRAPKKVRDPLWPGYRNYVRQYPCGVLEQAYRGLKTAAVSEAAE